MLLYVRLRDRYNRLEPSWLFNWRTARIRHALLVRCIDTGIVTWAEWLKYPEEVDNAIGTQAALIAQWPCDLDEALPRILTSKEWWKSMRSIRLFGDAANGLAMHIAVNAVPAFEALRAAMAKLGELSQKR